MVTCRSVDTLGVFDTSHFDAICSVDVKKKIHILGLMNEE